MVTVCGVVRTVAAILSRAGSKVAAASAADGVGSPPVSGFAVRDGALGVVGEPRVATDACCQSAFDFMAAMKGDTHHLNW